MTKDYKYLRKESLPFWFWLKKVIGYKILSSISEYNLSKREQPLAVFANDYIANYICIDTYYEKLLLDNIKTFLSPLKNNIKEWTAFDIGANIGNHSVYFSKVVKEVHAFEPNPLVYSLLKINAGLRNNIYCYNYGLGEREETVSMRVNDYNIGASSILNYSVDNEADTIQVKIRKLDDIINNFKSIDLLKIDVEGMELSVLKGSKILIEKHQPVILFEQINNSSEILEEKNKVSDFLIEKNYKLYCFIYPSWGENILKRKLNNLKEIIFNNKTIKIGVISVENITPEMIKSGKCQLIVAIPKKYQNDIV